MKQIGFLSSLAKWAKTYIIAPLHVSNFSLSFKTIAMNFPYWFLIKHLSTVLT